LYFFVFFALKSDEASIFCIFVFFGGNKVG
jgi:hypothetical protein